MGPFDSGSLDGLHAPLDVPSGAVELDEQVRAARAGDRAAFDALCRASLPKLRGVIRKMVGDPEQTNDLVQDALTKAWTSLGGFDGRASFSTWLCKIGVNLAIDFLRSEKRWRDRAQVAYANECASTVELGMEVGGVCMSPAYRYDVHEHIAFCFTCVGRSLQPEQQAALVLKEVEDLGNREAAQALGVTESVFRHRLSEARRSMEQSFEGLCALVNKKGVCYQCSGLRDAVPDPDRRGPVVPSSLPFERRLAIVREADVDAGASQLLHDVFWQRIAEQEREGRGTTIPTSDCATPPADPA